MLLAIATAVFSQISHTVSFPNSGVITPVYISGGNQVIDNYSSYPIVIPAFDTSLGTLTHVTIYYSRTPFVDFKWENKTVANLTPSVRAWVGARDNFSYRAWHHACPTSSNGGFWEINPLVNVLPWWNPDSDVTGEAHIRTVGNGNISWYEYNDYTGVTAFDGTLDFAGSSSWQKYATDPLRAAQIDVSSTGELNLWSTPDANGNITIYFSPRIIATAQIDPNLGVTFDPYVNWVWKGTHTINYSSTLVAVYTYL